MSSAEDRPTQLLIDARIARILNRVAEGSAVVVGVVGAAVLLGWVVGLGGRGVLEPVFAVFPTTAFSLAAVGGALVIVCRGELHGLRVVVVRVLGAVVVLVTAAGLLYAFGGVGTTLGQAISHLPGPRERSFPAPPPNSMLAMLSAGVMLLLFDTTFLIAVRHPGRGGRHGPFARPADVSTAWRISCAGRRRFAFRPRGRCSG